MAKLKVRHVGPIREGYKENNGFISFDGVTVFIGDQGSGKSTMAKLFASLAWLEKSLVRGDQTPNWYQVHTNARFVKGLLSYQNLHNYLSAQSYLEYRGDAFNIKYDGGTLYIEKATVGVDYHLPKIMYVPAERNFLSSVDQPEKAKRLPSPLYTFLDEYDKARNDLTGKVDLPIGNLKFDYRKRNKKTYIVGDDYEVNLLEASSGMQSLTPLYIVTKYLAENLDSLNKAGRKEQSLEEEEKISEEVRRIMNNKNLSEAVREAALEQLSRRTSYGNFYNIVEEPEQNLYPASQKKVLNELLRFKNLREKDQLVMTTHSPYLINYLTHAVKAWQVQVKIEAKANEEQKQKALAALKKIVPVKSALNPDQLQVFELDGDGNITKLGDYKGMPSDKNTLNEFLGESNDKFIDLLDLEDQWR